MPKTIKYMCQFHEDIFWEDGFSWVEIICYARPFVTFTRRNITKNEMISYKVIKIVPPTKLNRNCKFSPYILYSLQ